MACRKMLRRRSTLMAAVVERLPPIGEARAQRSSPFYRRSRRRWRERARPAHFELRMGALVERQGHQRTLSHHSRKFTPVFRHSENTTRAMPAASAARTAETRVPPIDQYNMTHTITIVALRPALRSKMSAVLPRFNRIEATQGLVSKSYPRLQHAPY